MVLPDNAARSVVRTSVAPISTAEPAGAVLISPTSLVGAAWIVSAALPLLGLLEASPGYAAVIVFVVPTPSGILNGVVARPVLSVETVATKAPLTLNVTLAPATGVVPAFTVALSVADAP